MSTAHVHTTRAANLLNDWFTSGRYQLAELTRNTRLTQLTSIRRLRRNLTLRSLERLLPELHPTDRVALVRCWLEDHVPETFRDHVQIDIRSPEGEGGRVEESEKSTSSLDDALSDDD